MAKPEQKAEKKLTKVEELILLIISIVFSYWAYQNIIDGAVTGKRDTYYLDESPLMFTVVLAPKLVLAIVSAYHIIKSRFLGKSIKLPNKQNNRD